ncbi:MAG: hypothetical protein KDD82_05695, partial [Planctomycetes bacterium]|nr:hypothetical protein [Planctomycetota bacterium]
MTRAPLWLCAALALSGCGAPSLQPLSASALKDWDELASYTDEQALAAAEADGRLAKHRVGRGELGRRSLDLITVEGLTDGAVQDLAVYCDVVRVDAEAERKPIAFLATLRDPATANSGGLTRGKLLLVVPERQLTGYTCDQAGTYLFYLRLPDGSAGLYAIARAAEGEAIDDFVEGQRWSSVVKRLERAVATGAALEQIRDEIACVEAIPFPEDRAAAEPLLETYVRELAQRADTIEAAWSGASLARRVVLTREAVDLAGAAAILPTRRFAQLAERLRPEVDAQLAEAAARAERERRGFS